MDILSNFQKVIHISTLTNKGNKYLIKNLSYKHLRPHAEMWYNMLVISEKPDLAGQNCTYNYRDLPNENKLS